MLSAADWAARCLAAFHRQDYAECAHLAQTALDQFPDDGLLWQLQGTAAWYFGDHARARQTLETASTLSPLQHLARCALAGAYAKTGDAALARDLFVSLLQDDRCPTLLLPKVATGLGCLGEHWFALQVCRKLARLQPSHHPAFFGLAYYMARLGYPGECYLRHLVRAHHLAPEMLPYRLNLAAVLTELGRAEHAQRLVRDLSPTQLSCPCQLQRLLAVYEAVGDEAGVRATQQRLAQLHSPVQPNS